MRPGVATLFAAIKSGNRPVDLSYSFLSGSKIQRLLSQHESFMPIARKRSPDTKAKAASSPVFYCMPIQHTKILLAFLRAYYAFFTTAAPFDIHPFPIFCQIFSHALWMPSSLLLHYIPNASPCALARLANYLCQSEARNRSVNIIAYPEQVERQCTELYRRSVRDLRHLATTTEPPGYAMHNALTGPALK